MIVAEVKPSAVINASHCLRDWIYHLALCYQKSRHYECSSFSRTELVRSPSRLCSLNSFAACRLWTYECHPVAREHMYWPEICTGKFEILTSLLPLSEQSLSKSSPPMVTETRPCNDYSVMRGNCEATVRRWRTPEDERICQRNGARQRARQWAMENLHSYLYGSGKNRILI